MRDYELEVLERYQADVKSTRRVRGAFFCETADGILLLKETKMSEKRACFLHSVLEAVTERAGIPTDVPVPSADGEFLVTARDGTRYMMKRWFKERECDMKRESEIVEAAALLGKLHMGLRQADAPWAGQAPVGREPLDEAVRRNMELKRIRSFIWRRPVKNEFEALYLKHFEEMHSVGLLVLRKMESSGCNKLYEASVGQGRLAHGDYNYHNVLMCQGTPAVTGFEHMKCDIQAKDFCYFLRKIMEKHRWDLRLGREILRAYRQECPSEDGEEEYMALFLAYPEKFWKAAGKYYRSPKSKLPEKSVEKLQLAVRQSEEKTAFLEHLFSFHLHEPVV